MPWFADWWPINTFTIQTKHKFATTESHDAVTISCATTTITIITESDRYQPFQTSHFQVHEYTAADYAETAGVNSLQQTNKLL